jgi:hypothetical protein
MSDTITEEVVLDETAQKALVEKTAEAVKPAIEEAVKSALERYAEEAVKKLPMSNLRTPKRLSARL